MHWDLCKQAGFLHAGRWYDHSPESVMENTNYKILWDFSIQTDHVIQARRPDLVFIEKKNKLCKIIDVAIPGDSRIESKEREKVEKYQGAEGARAGGSRPLPHARSGRVRCSCSWLWRRAAR